MIRTIRVFGIPVLRIETDDKPPPAADRGDCTTQSMQIGFVRDDLPTWHRPEGDNQ